MTDIYKNTEINYLYENRRPNLHQMFNTVNRKKYHKHNVRSLHIKDSELNTWYRLKGYLRVGWLVIL